MAGTLEIYDSKFSKIKIINWKIELSGYTFTSSGNTMISSPYFTIDDKAYCIAVTHGFNSMEYKVNLSKVDEKMGKIFDYVIECYKSDGSVISAKNSSVPITRIKFGQSVYPVENTWTFICEIYQQENTNCSEEKLKEISSQTDVLECIEQLSQDMKELLISSRHADITIKVGSKEFKAHKSILAARSPDLDSMFSHQMSEKETGILNIIDTDESAFEAFLMFLYTGKIREISICKVTGLYEIADKYDMKELKIECVKRLLNEMSVDSVCDSLRLANLHEEKLLLETAIKCFVENVEEVLDTEKWDSFYNDHIKFGKELLKKSFSARPK